MTKARGIWAGAFAAALLGAACGSVGAGADAAGGDDDADAGDGDAGIDAGLGPDADVPRFTRVFHVMPGDMTGSLYAADVDDGVVAAAVHLSTPVVNPTTNANNPSSAVAGDVVLYTADAETEGLPALYLVRYGAGGPAAPVKLSGNHGAGQVGGFQLARDGSKAIYTWGTPGAFSFTVLQYYLVDLSAAAPGTPVPLTGGNNLGGSVLSPDGTKFVFEENQQAFVVDVSGDTPSAAVKISGTGVAGTTLGSLVMSPTGTRVAYVSDALVDDKFELFVVDLSGAVPGAPQKASGPLIAAGDVTTGFFGISLHRFSPDGRRLAYQANASVASVQELFVVDVSTATPGTAHKVNGTLVSGGAVSDGSSGAIFVTPWAFSPDSRRLAYRADERTDEVIELFVADVSTAVPGTPVRVSGALAAGGDVLGVEFAADGSGLVYTADQDVDDRTEIYYVNLRSAVPSTPMRANGELVAGGDVYYLGLSAVVALSPDGKKLAYAADEKLDGRVEVFITDVSTGTPGPSVRTQAASTATPVVFSLLFSADSTLLVWTSNSQLPSFDVWLADVEGATVGPVQQVNTVPGFGGLGIGLSLAP